MTPALSLTAIWALIFAAQIPMVAIYLLRLARDPLYGWWPSVLLLCGLILVAWQWDRRLNYPSRLLPFVSLIVGIVAALGSAWLQADWLAGLGLCFTAYAFLATHRHRNGTTLTPLSYITWGVLMVPLGGNTWLTNEFALSVERGVANILRLLDVPHINYFGAIRIPGVKYYIDEAVYSYLGWPLFVAVGLLYSAYFRRTWWEAVLNVLSAMLWCYTFHCGLLLTYAVYSLDPQSWGAGWAVCGWASVAWLLFLSTERGLRILLLPISESSADARLVNPFILAWNWCFSKPKRRRVNSDQSGPWSKTALRLALVVLGLTLLSQILQAPRTWAALHNVNNLNLNRPELETFVFKNEWQFDYRHTVHAPPLVLNRQVDVWTVTAPLATTEHILFSQPQPVFDVNLLAATEGWRIEGQELVPARLPDGQPLIYGTVTLRQGRQYVRLLYGWLGVDGRPLQPDAVDAAGYLLISRSELVELCHVNASKNAITLFSRFVVGVQNQIVGSPTAM
jgi:hypothetical protein